jgi:parallel beta-helix repeat protein
MMALRRTGSGPHSVLGSLARILVIAVAFHTLVPIGAALASHSPTHFIVSQSGSNYVAQSQTKTYTNTLKIAVETAVADLKAAAGGTLTFQAGVFDLGATYFRLENMTDITIEGQGMDVTFIQNFTTEAHDREPFNTQGATRVIIRDLTVSAGGPPRTTSDAIDMDKGNNVLIERVKITASRGKGIIFDGKDAGWTSQGNTVRDCIISGTNNDGIQLLASSSNRVEGCFIHDTVEDGIETRKSQSNAPQPHKKSNDNVIIGNTIDNAGQNGIRIHSSDRNLISGNYITNSSDDTVSQDGIRIISGDSITCDDNRVEGNTATDNQATKTQAYGLNIASSLCNRTFVGTNNFTGNKTGTIRDVGTNTRYGTSDTQPPTGPGGPPVASPPPAVPPPAIPPSATPPPSCQGRVATLWGTAASDTLLGTPGKDVVAGLAGADTIRGLGGRDLICAGPGGDKVIGGPGNDALQGGGGRDRLVGGKGKDSCVGGSGKDTAIGCESRSGSG